ncbi:hypothetical protein KM043_009266 [Ampulex compressa]|nr:hypothetical protein KM043_009266 [Ampulex compressa]
MIYAIRWPEYPILGVTGVLRIPGEFITGGIRNQQREARGLTLEMAEDHFNDHTNHLPCYQQIRELAQTNRLCSLPRRTPKYRNSSLHTRSTFLDVESTVGMDTSKAKKEHPEAQDGDEERDSRLFAPDECAETANFDVAGA